MLQFGRGMRMTNLNKFFRDAGAAITRSPEVRQAVTQATRQLETALAKEITRGLERFADRFDPAKTKPAKPAAPSAEQVASNSDYVRSLYRELLQREPDIGGFNAHMAGLAGGTTREQLRDVFLNSAEYAELQSRPSEPTPAPVEPTPAPAPAPTPELREPGAPLRSVPLKAEYLEANIDKSSPAAAVLSAARWARVKYAPLFDNASDRNVANGIMTHVIGALRVAGYDAYRVVNHPSLPDGARYGSDAVVLNGAIWDVYRAMGEASEPVAQNMGPYAAGRLRE